MEARYWHTIFCLILLTISFASADVQFYQDRKLLGNGTLDNHAFVLYSKSGYFNNFANDYITGNNPYQVYLYYNAYVNKWNLANPMYKVSYCNFEVLQQKWGNQSVVLLNQNFTDSDIDLMSAKFFISMSDKDSFRVEQICYFQNLSYGFENGLDMPMDFQVMTPTWECKSC